MFVNFDSKISSPAIVPWLKLMRFEVVMVVITKIMVFMGCDTI
jgi:hypothetical protein